MGWFEGVGARARRRGWLVLGYGVVPGLSQPLSQNPNAIEKVTPKEAAILRVQFALLVVSSGIVSN